MRNFALAICLFFSTVVTAQFNIIPQPVKIETDRAEKPFLLTAKTKIVLGPMGEGLEIFSNYLNLYLQKAYDIKLPVVSGSNTPDKNYIQISLAPTAIVKNKPAYALHVNESNISIAADQHEGLFYAMQTLIQFLPATQQNNSAFKAIIPSARITDYPRFPYRGAHLDCGRNFMPVDFVKKFIDYLALHKMNYFHWHLTEDQGWRIEIKKYPQLTETGSWRNGTIIGRHPGTENSNMKTGGFYTQDQIKEIVQYAGDRFITIVPEIEMPGHSSAAIAAIPSLSCFPNEPTINYFPKGGKWSGDRTGKQVQQAWGVYSDVFCAGKEETFRFLQDVIDEVAELFPGKYIHVGGDECPKSNWKKCNLCQQRIKDNNLKDEHELQSYFIQRMEKYINNKGKTLIGWDEILEGGLAPNAIVMSWRGEKGGIEAAKEKHDVIMTPTSHVYLDYSQSENEDSVVIGGYLPVEKVYSYEPIPKELNEDQAKYILGAQGNVWTEYMNNPRKVEYMIFPRLTALSEVLWSPKEKKNWEDFENRLQVQFKRYDLWKANYSKAYYDLKASVLPTPDFSGVLWKLESKIKNGSITYQANYSTKTSNYSDPIKVSKSSNIIANLYSQKKIMSFLEQQFIFNKATGKYITLLTSPSNTYKGDGAFTLVNGILNKKGLGRAKEFLGFSGTDCEAIIDLRKEEKITTVTIHAYKNEESWIYQPLYAEVFVSVDGKDYSSIRLTDDFIESENGHGIMQVKSDLNTPVRFVKVLIKNWGKIPPNKPGADNGAWLFVDEIEIN